MNVCDISPAARWLWWLWCSGAKLVLLAVLWC